MKLADAFEQFAPELQDGAPDHIPVDRFRRVALTAINQSTPEQSRRRRSAIAVQRANQMRPGRALPDGREAALVVFNTRMKDATGV
jgi:recombination protein RecT